MIATKYLKDECFSHRMNYVNNSVFLIVHLWYHLLSLKSYINPDLLVHLLLTVTGHLIQLLCINYHQMAFSCLWSCTIISELWTILFHEVLSNKNLSASSFSLRGRGNIYINMLKETWLLVLFILSTLGKFFYFCVHLHYHRKIKNIGLAGQSKHILSSSCSAHGTVLNILENIEVNCQYL